MDEPSHCKAVDTIVVMSDGFIDVSSEPDRDTDSNQNHDSRKPD